MTGSAYRVHSGKEGGRPRQERPAYECNPDTTMLITKKLKVIEKNPRG